MDRRARYTWRKGDQKREIVRHPDSPQQPEPYIASDELIDAVNLAIYLRRPLLLEGEAGSGKTRLAKAVAYELGLPLYPWYVRSSSKAQEGLYRYDAILRLHDVHVPHSQTVAGETAKVGALPRRDPQRATDYRILEALGKAFMQIEYRAVVLIDEIDKADLDFPNDLLAILDDPWSFHIPETGEVIKASKDYLPIVIITSNREKGNLPAPFLRRCIYYYIEFPNEPERLKEIVDAHYPPPRLGPTSPELIDKAAKRFLDLRRAGDLHKNPGISEFLDWLEALCGFDKAAYPTNRLGPKDPLPYPQLLLKLRADWQRYVPS